MSARIPKLCVAGIFAACLLTMGNIASAAPVCPVPREVTQPDGTVITVTSYGDEFFCWHEDEGGNVIAYDKGTGSYRYAEIEGDALQPTGQVVGASSLRSRSTGKLQREDILPLWENAERADYSRPKDTRARLAAAGGDAVSQSPSSIKKLLTVLIEFNDVKLKSDGAYWAKQMYSTNPRDISVVNYWKENANGADVFEASDTSTIQDGATGTVSNGEFVDVGYTITKCPEGVVKIALDMPHPIKTWSNDWNNDSGEKAGAVQEMVIEAINPYYDFEGQTPYTVFVFAGYTVPNGEGLGQISARASMSGPVTPDGYQMKSTVIQGELGYNNVPEGIGTTCHELGHSAFRLPDLYFAFMPNGGWINNGLMYCSLMSTGCWGRLYNKGEPSEHNIWDDSYANVMNHVPTHLDPWCKIQCGFVTPTIINDWDGDINSISPNGLDSQYNVLEIRSRVAADQYFLVENRQLTGYDSGLKLWSEAGRRENPFEGGIIIYHVDDDTLSVNNNSSCYHHFMMAEHTIRSEGDDFIWEYRADRRNKLNGETTPNSNLHEIKTETNWSCSRWDDCHPQTLKSGISIEVLGDNGPSVRVTANVDKEYRVTMAEGATFTELFPDPNFRRAVLDNMKDKDGMAREPDSVLTIRDWATLAGIDNLRMDGYGVRDLTGIEYFPILDWLNCNNNELTEISPKQIPNLILLDCESNQLKNLDLSQWENLTYLFCSDNELKDLDTSNNPELYYLYCSNNLLPSLDLSKNRELYELECSNNRLTSLDLTNNLGLEILTCYGNYLGEDPKSSITAPDSVWEMLGPPLSMDDPDNWLAYYPQNPPEEEHSWDSGRVTLEPTCTEKGEMTYTCADCAATKTSDIAALGHQWDAWTITAKPSLTATGTAQRVCGNDNSHTESVSLPVLTDTTVWTKGSVVGGKQEYTSIYGTVAVAIPAPPPIDSGTPDVPDEPDPPDQPDIPPMVFTDVRDSDWFYDSVSYIYEQGLMAGTEKDQFSPNLNASRAMIATILWRQDGSPAPTGKYAYTDGKPNAYYAQAVAWATEQGVLTGYGEGLFGPNDPITREQLAAALYRYAGKPGTKGSLDRFTDGNTVSSYALDALRWAVETGIISGKGDGILDPTGKATRAEVAAILHRFITALES